MNKYTKNSLLSIQSIIQDKKEKWNELIETNYNGGYEILEKTVECIKILEANKVNSLQLVNKILEEMSVSKSIQCYNNICYFSTYGKTLCEYINANNNAINHDNDNVYSNSKVCSER